MGGIFHIRGPFPAKWPDLKIFQDCLKHKKHPSEFVEANKGYHGEPNCIRAPNHVATVEDSKIKWVARNRHKER
jgi:hypothetical protein